MRKLFFAIAAMAAMLTSCSKDDTFGGPTRGKVTFEVSTPELATRAYGDGTTATNLYYAVYDVTEKEEGVRVDTNYGTTATDDDVTLSGLKATVSIDLVEGRQYEVAFWAESGNSPYVFKLDQKSVCYEGSTDDLVANNEDYDAFFAYVGKDDVKVGQTVNVTLKRPFAQLNVATNDTVRAGELGVVVKQTGITVEAYTSFNLQTGKVNGEKTSLTFGFNDVTEKMDGKIEAVIDGENREYDWLTMNYILVNERENVDVTFNFTDARDKVYTRPYVAVPVERNHRTNVIGSILTSPTDFNVEIKPEMQTTEHNVGVTRKVTNVEELIEAIENIEDGGTIVLEENIGLTDVLEIGVNANTSLKAQNSLNSNVVTRTETTDVPTIVVNGNGKTISSSASRVFRITSSNINVVFSDLTINATSTVKGNGSSPDSIRGISIDPSLQNVSLTLNDCNVVFSDPEVGKDWAYAVNVSGSGSGHKVTINGGEYEGANVINVHGANNIVTVNNAILTSLYPDHDEYFGACIWVLQNQGSKVFAKGNKFNGDNAVAFNLGTGTELTESDNIDNCLDYKDINGNYSIFTAEGLKWFAAQVNAKNTFEGKTVKLHADIDLQNKQWTPIGYWETFDGTFDGQNHTISNLYHHATELDCYIGLFGCTNNATIKNLTIDNVDIKLIGDNEWAGGHVGALIGYPDGATVIDNVNVTGLVKIEGDTDKSGGQRIGSVIGGYACTSISMKNISVDVDSGSSIKGHLFVGGVAGAPLGVVTMENVTSNIKVYSKAGIVGGIIGYANPNSSFTNVSASGTVTRLNTAADDTEEQYLRIGGIVGSWNGPVTLTNCNFTGRLQANYPNGMAIASDAFLNNSLVGGEYGNSEDLGTGKLTIDGNVYMQKSAAQKALEAAIAAAEDGATVTLSADLTLTETLEIPEGKNITLDLNGKTLSAGASEGGYAINNDKGGTLTIKDSANTGVINGIVYTETGKTIINGGTYNAIENGKYVLLNSSGELTINKATINGGSSYPIYSYNEGNKLVINDVTVNATFGCVNSYGLGGVVEINGGTFEMTGVQGKTSHIAYFSGVDATINGGTFKKIGDISMSGTGGGGICAINGANLTIKGGNFAGDYADVYDWGGKTNTIAIQGGTFKFEPTAVAEGYEAVANGDGTFTVKAQ